MRCTVNPRSRQKVCPQCKRMRFIPLGRTYCTRSCERAAERDQESENR